MFSSAANKIYSQNIGPNIKQIDDKGYNAVTFVDKIGAFCYHYYVLLLNYYFKENLVW